MFCNAIIFSPKHPILESKPWLDIIDRSNHAFNPSSKHFGKYEMAESVIINNEIIKSEFYFKFNVGQGRT